MCCNQHSPLCQCSSTLYALPYFQVMLLQILRSFRYSRWVNLGQLNETLSCMCQLFHPTVSPILQHAKDLTTVIVTIRRLMFIVEEALHRAEQKPSPGKHPKTRILCNFAPKFTPKQAFLENMFGGVWNMTPKHPLIESKIQKDSFSQKTPNQFWPLFTFSLKKTLFFRVSLVLHMYNTIIRVPPPLGAKTHNQLTEKLPVRNTCPYIQSVPWLPRRFHSNVRVTPPTSWYILRS